MSRILKKVFIVAFVFVSISSCFADFWEAITPYRGPKRDVITLMITGNYKHPLVITQLVQEETKQPYLLLPAINGKGIFFNPPSERSKEALEINEENLVRFIKFLNPKQIVILGDKQYVPNKYREMIAKEIPVITIEGSNWQRVADRVSILLDAGNVSYDYKKLGQQLNSGLLYEPKKTKDMVDEPIKDIDVKTDVDDIVIDKKAEVKDAKEELVKEAVAEPKKEAVKEAVKEPETAMPKSTPKLISDK